MKSSIVLALVLLMPAISMAAAKCPSGTRQIYNCKSTPQEGDGIIASEYFTSIKVCEGAGDNVQLVMISGSTSGVEAASKSERIGGVSYTVTADNVTVSLSIATSTNPNLDPAARLYLEVAGMKTDSTYVCK